MNPSGNVQFVYVVGDVLPEEVDDSTIYIVGTEKKSIYVGSELIVSDLTGDIETIEEQIGNNTLGTSVPKYDVSFTDHTYSASNGSTDGTITITQEAIYAPNDTGEHHQQIPAVSFTPKVGGWDEVVASIPKSYYTATANSSMGNKSDSTRNNFNLLSYAFLNNTKSNNTIIGKIDYGYSVKAFSSSASIILQCYLGNNSILYKNIPVTSTGHVYETEMIMTQANQLSENGVAYIGITSYNCTITGCDGTVYLYAGNLSGHTNYVEMDDFDEWTATGNVQCSYQSMYGGWLITTDNASPASCKLTKTFNVEGDRDYTLIIDTMMCDGVSGYASIEMEDLSVGATSYPPVKIDTNNQGGFRTYLTTNEEATQMKITIDLSNVYTTGTAMFLLNKMYLA